MILVLTGVFLCQAVAPSIVAEIKVLGEEKHKKAQEWTDRTKEKFEDAIKAANGK